MADTRKFDRPMRVLFGAPHGLSYEISGVTAVSVRDDYSVLIQKSDDTFAVLREYYFFDILEDE